MSQPQGSDLWNEPSANGATPAALFARLQFDGTDWVLATSGDADGKFIPDENGDYVIVDTRTEVLLVADGSDYGINTVGTAIAVLADDSGDVTISTDLTGLADTVAAELYQDLDGNTVMVRRDNPELKLLLIRGDYIGYEVS